MRKRRNKKPSRISQEPVTLPFPVYQQTLRFLKIAQKAAGKWDTDAADFYSVITHLVIDLEHAQKEYAHK